MKSISANSRAKATSAVELTTKTGMLLSAGLSGFAADAVANATVCPLFSAHRPTSTFTGIKSSATVPGNVGSEKKIISESECGMFPAQRIGVLIPLALRHRPQGRVAIRILDVCVGSTACRSRVSDVASYCAVARSPFSHQKSNGRD